MRRWLFTILSVVSLLFCAAICALWVRSYSVADSFYWTDRAPGRILDWTERGFTCSSGGVEIFHHHAIEPPGTLSIIGVPRGHHFDHFREQPTDYPYFGYPWPASSCTNVRFAGFQVFHAADANDQIQAGTLPLAGIALSAIVLPGMWIRRELKRRRDSKTNLCPNCGYDLRATPDRCPECGTVAGKAEGEK
jgi:predicted RNA-binding Zn-ribbon protein involved in translation (DUF1610 family)